MWGLFQFSHCLLISEDYAELALEGPPNSVNITGYILYDDGGLVRRIYVILRHKNKKITQLTASPHP